MPPPQQAPSPPPPMLGEGLAGDDPGSSEQPFIAETTSPQHWGDAQPLAAKQGGAAARPCRPLLPNLTPPPPLRDFLRKQRQNNRRRGGARPRGFPGHPIGSGLKRPTRNARLPSPPATKRRPCCGAILRPSLIIRLSHNAHPFYRHLRHGNGERGFDDACPGPHRDRKR
ncbi:MAG: hypothetical protein UZ07_CHB004002615 [Chlorobi bacterium OLB7]|nr:MAG: hypothetical protein UZ07_CHB004002615 [Chlorobi bacterium OLB7]